MAKIIILNGPPGCGKDTIGNLLTKNVDHFMHMVSFKKPLFDIAASMLSKRDFRKFLLAYNYRELKESPLGCLNGMSPREFIIWISEEVIKPRFGSGYFGDRLTSHINEIGNYDVVCTDGGFIDEIISLVMNSNHQVKLCRLHRNGFTFENDSRDYISLPDYYYDINGYQEFDMHLLSGNPMFTVNEIKARVLNSTNY